MTPPRKCKLSRKKLNKNSTKKLFDSILLEEYGLDTVRTLLQEGADVNAKNSKGLTPILLACFHLKSDVVELLIENGANVDCRNANGYTVLHYAAINFWSDIVWDLAEKVPDLNIQDISGETALHHAAKSGYVILVQGLVKEGADMNKENFVGFTPILYAAQNAYKDVVDLLLDAGANIDGCKRLLLYYATRNDWPELVQSLEDKIADPFIKRVIWNDAPNMMINGRHLEILKCLLLNQTESNTRMICQAALHDASSMGHLDVVKWLVKKGRRMKGGLDLNARNKWGRTALLTALFRDHRVVAKFLVEAGADMNMRDEFGETALHMSSCSGHLDMVRFLVEKGADFTIEDEYGATALHEASNSGHLDIVKYLVENGSDINTLDEFGETVLHEASKIGHLDLVKYFVEQGTDINLRNCHGFTPMICAAEFKQKEVVSLLMSLGASVAGCNWNGQTMLHMAAGLGWTDIARSLVEKGCDLDARDKKGQTPLGGTCLMEKFDTAKYLLQAGASWDTVDEDGKSPLNYITGKEKSPEMEMINGMIKLLIDSGAYFNPKDYEAIVENSTLSILQDKELCCQSVLNKFNYHDLPELYKLPVPRSLPGMEKLRITTDSEVARSIERRFEFQIQTKGHCNVLECPMTLGVFSVRSAVEYYEKKKLELKKQLKRPATFRSSDKYQRTRKSMRLR